MNPLELKGCRAAVLGSTSGIGRAVALELAGPGPTCSFTVVGRREAAEEVAESVRRRGGRSEVLMADLADRAAGDRLVDAGLVRSGAASTPGSTSPVPTR